MSVPTSTVTFVFTDVEGSTRLLERDRTTLGRVMAEHHAILRTAIEASGGEVFETVGDAVYAAFADPRAALRAAADGQRSLHEHDWGDAEPLRVRMAVHTGEVESHDGHFFGEALFRCARIQSLAHGGQILVSDETRRLVGDAPPERTGLVDLGSHRLRDLVSIERVSQLVVDGLGTEFPPLRSIGSRPHNLPARHTALVGRRREIRDVRAAMESSRIVTITGPGGIGKTRLAIEVASMELDRTSDGAFLVDLSGARDATVATSTTAIALGLGEARALTVEAVIDHLRPRELLLVLDNVEQIPDIGGLVARFLDAGDRLRVLTTSRRPIGVRAEHVIEVPPLSLSSASGPGSGGGPTSEAITLFIERARASGARLGLDAETLGAVERICERLDGVPLAIELAATRARAIPPTLMAIRLGRDLELPAGPPGDRPDRQRTLRSTIAWSCQLLTGDESRLFRRLGVFARGFELEAAEAVIPDTVDDPLDVLAGLASLADQSLLRAESTAKGTWRYSMLETIRGYALEEAAAAAELEATRERHFRYYLAMATATREAIDSGEGRESAEDMERELDNVRAALRWLDEAGRDDDLLALVAEMARIWNHRGHTAEAMDWTNRALTKAPEGDALARARLFLPLWSIELAVGSADGADRAIREAVRLFELGGDEVGLARALTVLGNHESTQGRHEAARVALTRAIDISTRIDAPVIGVVARTHLAVDAQASDDVAGAVMALEVAYAESRRLGDPRALRLAASELASLRICLDDHSGALEPARAAIQAQDDLGMQDGWAYAVLAAALGGTGAAIEAARAIRRAVELTESRHGTAEVPMILEAWAVVELRAGDPAVVTRCLGAAARIADDVGYVAPPLELRHAAALADRARAALAAERFASEWSAGAASSVQECLELVRSRAGDIDRAER